MKPRAFKVSMRFFSTSSTSEGRITRLSFLPVEVDVPYAAR